MSARIVVEDRQLRLARRASGGYWVRLADTGRTLGMIWLQRSRWHWLASGSAFRGDGRPGHENDGDPSESVPDHLMGGGSSRLRRDACELLVEHLIGKRAPALGYGPHPDVGRVARDLVRQREVDSGV